MIAVKIKPGTAARLGLRSPAGPQLGLITMREPLPSEEIQRIKDRFEEAMGLGWQVVHHVPERPWWGRWLR